MMRRRGCLLLAAALSFSQARADEWAYYGRDAGGSRFSPLTQITPANVAGLKPVWTFHTGDISTGSGGVRRSGFETTPLVLDGRLYLTTPFNRVIALDAASGRQVWAHDPVIDKAQPYGDGLINRGVAAWRDPQRPAACATRLFEATLDARLIALDGATGRPCAGFGTAGEVDLKDVPGYRPGWYHLTSPPIVIDGVVVVGSAIDDNARAAMPDGVVRGFDARSGRKLWSWSPLVDAKGTGAGNAWSVMSADPARHLVYVPTGSASPDYYGGLRPGDNRWANAVVALDSRTGALKWGFQLVHHDLWDYDTAAPPLLTRLPLNGKTVPAVIAGNKTGMLYVLDPATGKPLLPVEERAVPPSDVPGEAASPTQPFSASLPQLARWSLAPSDAWGANESARAECRKTLEGLSGTSLFSPPSTRGIASVPGPIGGINWSGFAWDGAHKRLIVAVSNLAYRIQLIPAEKFAGGARGDFRGDAVPQTGAAFAMTRAAMIGSGGPCTPPPWGELVALDLAGGKIAWRASVGTMDDVIPGIGKAGAGSPLLGGPIVTAGGLVFIGGSMDRRFHAFSAETGREVWSAELPASGHAQPITYEVNGRQYVVIAAGGSAPVREERQGDSLIAYALP